MYNFLSPLISISSLRFVLFTKKIGPHGHFVAGEWYARTLLAMQEKYAGRGYEVRLLLLLPFIDSTRLDNLSKTSAKPIIIIIGNVSLRLLRMDDSKFLYSIHPTIRQTAAERREDVSKDLDRYIQSKCIEILLRELQVRRGI